MSAEMLEAAREAAMNAARINPRSGHPHGKMMREVLVWAEVEQAILGGPGPISSAEAEQMALVAFDRLCEKRKEFQHLRDFLPAIE